MKRKLLIVVAAAAILSGVAAYAIDSTQPAKAAGISAVPPISGAGAALCYWNDQLQPYAIDGGQDAVAPRTDLTGAYYGALEAVTSNGSSAEEFDICYNWIDRYWYMVSVGTGLFVSAEILYPGLYSGMLRARSEEVGPWERYTLGCQNDLLTIQSQANGKFVSTELAYPAPFTNVLRARATVVGPWEMYRDTDQICSNINPI